jgi:hypothetical protein
MRDFQLAEQELDRIMNLQNYVTRGWQMREVLKATGFEEELGAYDILLRLKYALEPVTQKE